MEVELVVLGWIGFIGRVVNPLNYQEHSCGLQQTGGGYWEGVSLELFFFFFIFIFIFIFFRGERDVRVKEIRKRLEDLRKIDTQERDLGRV